MIIYTIQKLDPSHKGFILESLMTKFNSMCSSYPYYSKKYTTKEILEKHVNWMTDNHCGFVLYDKKKPVSFIHNIMCDQLFYKEKGLYTAEWGYFF